MNRAACALVAFFCFIGALAASAAVAPLPSTAPGMLALIKATPQLEIDPTLPNPTGDKSSPWVRVRHAAEGTNGGYIDASYANRGTLTDGTRVLAVPLVSGGSGGVFTQIVFAQRGKSAARYAGFISSGGHLGVRVRSGALVAEFADYGANDAQCCPSHWLHQKYAITAGKLRLVTSWRTTKM